MGEQQAEFAERTVDILESKIDNLQETLYKEKLNYRIRLNDIEMSYLIQYKWFQMICSIWYVIIMPIFVNCYQRGISEQLDKTLNIMMSMWYIFYVTIIVTQTK